MAIAIDIERSAVERAYDRWAPVYDLVFGPVFERGRRAAIVAAERIGGRILEVGVGTGISLPDYSRANRIVGVDISAAMLDKARERVVELGLDHVEALEVMDAERLDFPDDSFDVVVAQYVVTAVPNPEAALDEFVARAQAGRRDRHPQPRRRRSRAAARRSSTGSRRRRASSAGAPNSPGNATRAGPRARRTST